MGGKEIQCLPPLPRTPPLPIGCRLGGEGVKTRKERRDFPPFRSAPDSGHGLGGLAVVPPGRFALHAFPDEPRQFGIIRAGPQGAE